MLVVFLSPLLVLSPSVYVFIVWPAISCSLSATPWCWRWGVSIHSRREHAGLSAQPEQGELDRGHRWQPELNLMQCCSDLLRSLRSFFLLFLRRADSRLIIRFRYQVSLLTLSTRCSCYCLVNNFSEKADQFAVGTWLGEMKTVATYSDISGETSCPRVLKMQLSTCLDTAMLTLSQNIQRFQKCHQPISQKWWVPQGWNNIFGVNCPF